jgi:hypothetical protein
MPDTFLTSKQLKVLELRGKGYTQEEIARLIGTSRVNVTITEKRAKENIQKARKTIEAYEKLNPVALEISRDMDIFEVPKRIFSEADKHGIKVLHNTPSLIGIMRRRLGDRIIGNKVTSKFKVQLLRSGKVIFE